MLIIDFLSYVNNKKGFIIYRKNYQQKFLNCVKHEAICIFALIKSIDQCYNINNLIVNLLLKKYLLIFNLII